jgi:hypothetical protein
VNNLKRKKRKHFVTVIVQKSFEEVCTCMSGVSVECCEIVCMAWLEVVVTKSCRFEQKETVRWVLDLLSTLMNSLLSAPYFKHC